jgi:hypothetical protein
MRLLRLRIANWPYPTCSIGRHMQAISPLVMLLLLKLDAAVAAAVAVVGL